MRILILLPLLLLFSLVCFGAPFLFSAVSPAAAGDNLLLNPGFEEWTEDTLVGWQKSASSYFAVTKATESGKINGGATAALLTLATSNYRYLYQEAPVSAGTAYRFSGFLKVLSGNVNALLRLAWYCATCNNQLSKEDSTALTSGGFSELALETTAPPGAAKVQARVVVNPASGSTDNSVLVDSLQLVAVPADVPAQTVQTDSMVASSPASLSPEIGWETVSQAVVGESFKAAFSLKDFTADTEYYIKLRGGTEEGKLNQLRTQSGAVFLADTAGWEKFPVIKTDGSGNASGEVYGQMDEEKAGGVYKLMLRLREKAERTPHDFYESAMKEIVFSQPVVVADTVVSSASTAAGVASGAAAASSNKRTSPAEKENLLAPLVLATTAAGGAFPAEQADGGGSAENNLDFFSLGLIAAGMVLSGAAVVAGLAREKIIAAVLGIIKRV